MPESKPSAQSKVSPEEMKIAYSGPAVHANKMYLTLGGALARIAFAEMGQNQEPIFRTAVVMQLGELLQLRDLIDRFAKDIQVIAVPEPESDA